MLKKNENSVDAIYRFVGNRLRAHRTRNGLTQSDVARHIGVSPQQYQKYEEAHSKCSLTSLFKLVELFEVDINDIIPVNVDQYGEPEAPAVSKDISLAPQNVMSDFSQDSEADLLARLVSAFMRLKTVEARQNLVRFLESSI